MIFISLFRRFRVFDFSPFRVRICKLTRQKGDPTSVLFTKEGQEMLNDGKIFRLMSDMKKFQEPTYEQVCQFLFNK
jgi:hypothetical protein